MRKLAVFALMATLSLTLLGCATSTKPATLPPGALNQFDLTSYESLMGAQAVVNSVKADIAQLPPAAKPALNKAIASYNAAEAAWQAYHAGASNNQAALNAAITQVVADVAALITAITGAK